MYGEKRTPIFFSSVLVRKGREQTDKYYCTSKKKGAGEGECNICCVLFILLLSTMNLSAKERLCEQETDLYHTHNMLKRKRQTSLVTGLESGYFSQE
jgi:hypothetical protein